MDICESYKATNNRIILFSKDNRGLTSALIIGLDMATCDYIAFVDSNDWQELEIHEILIKVSVKCHSEIVSCDINTVYPDEIIAISNNTGAVKLYTRKELYDN